ncbi:MAG: ABC transporter permease subunit [Eubacteriales bacterium]|nr:ABC transporter permease subunit [Eubacteriales bacterium]
MRKKQSRHALGLQMKRYGNLFPFFLPAAVFALIFAYVPMAGLVMAFKENPNLLGAGTAVEGILEADWVGLRNFQKIFSNPDFLSAFANTLVISSLKILVVFPLPIALAIVINEMKARVLKKWLQIVMYLPYFLSWATIAGIFVAMLNQQTGVINNLLEALGHQRIDFLTSNSTFQGLMVGSTAWKDLGWSSITYLATISALDPCINEAAKIDGASKFQQIFYVTLPGIMPTIAVMFILRIGYIMDAGFEQVFVFYSPFVQKSGDILGMYTYRLITQSSFIPQYALSTATGLFNSVVALILVLGGNAISRKLFHRGIW